MSESARIDTNQLESCPFCGGEAYVWNEVMWHVGCDNMSCVAYSVHNRNYYTRDEAIAAWNTRAQRTTTRSGKYKTKYGRRVPLCEHCGYAIGDDRYNFCPKCGARIVEEL